MSEIEFPTPIPEIANPLTAPGRALGRDPFDDLAGPNPLEEQLDQLEARQADGSLAQRRVLKPTAKQAAIQEVTAKQAAFEQRLQIAEPPFFLAEKLDPRRLERFG